MNSLCIPAGSMYTLQGKNPGVTSAAFLMEILEHHIPCRDVVNGVFMDFATGTFTHPADARDGASVVITVCRDEAVLRYTNKSGKEVTMVQKRTHHTDITQSSDPHSRSSKRKHPQNYLKLLGRWGRR